LLVLVLLLTV